MVDSIEASEATILVAGAEHRPLEGVAPRLAEEGYRLLYTSMGEEALYIMALNPVDLVLIDVALPDMDAVELCRRIRATAGIGEVPILLYGDQAERGDRINAFDHGADGLLTGEHDFAELKARVRSILRLNRYRRLHDQAAALENSEKQLEALRQYDQATGLPNAALFRATLQQELNRAKRSDYPAAVLVVDINDYDQLVGIYGQDGVDTLTSNVADRLATSVRGRAVVGRLDKRCFAICQPLPRAEELDGALQHYRRALADTVSIDNEEVQVSTSIGASVYPSDALDADRLIHLGVSAMSHARHIGRNKYHVYAPSARAEAKRRLRLEAQISKAVANEDLELHYQPRLSLADGAVTGVEALLRLRQDNGGLMSPGVFMPVAEDAGLMDALGLWALRKGCADAAMFREWGEYLRVSVNLTPELFLKRHFVRELIDALRSNVIDGSHLELEITESALRHTRGEDMRSLCELMNAVRNEGVTIALDDFGSGYSCLDHLRYFPLDVLKVSQRLVADVTSDPKAEAVAQSVVSLGHNLGLTTVAEGIETDRQMALMQALGCDQAQGFLYSRAVPVQRLQAALASIADDWSTARPAPA